MGQKLIVRCAWVGDDPIYVKYHDQEWGVPVGRPPLRACDAEKPSSAKFRKALSDFSSLDISKDISQSDKNTPRTCESLPEQKFSTTQARIDDQKQFEFLTLESAQAGLSWITILKRREGYREVFHGFDPVKVAAMDEDEIQKALQNPKIIRNKLKVRAAVKNAQVFLEIQKEFGSFSEYIWGFVGGKPIVNNWRNKDEVPATSKISDALSKDLKKRGMSFVGSTIIYAHLQAAGLINDHEIDCFRYNEVYE